MIYIELRTGDRRALTLSYLPQDCSSASLPYLLADRNSALSSGFHDVHILEAGTGAHGTGFRTVLVMERVAGEQRSRATTFHAAVTVTRPSTKLGRVHMREASWLPAVFMVVVHIFGARVEANA